MLSHSRNIHSRSLNRDIQLPMDSSKTSSSKRPRDESPKRSDDTDIQSSSKRYKSQDIKQDPTGEASMAFLRLPEAVVDLKMDSPTSTPAPADGKLDKGKGKAKSKARAARVKGRATGGWGPKEKVVTDGVAEEAEEGKVRHAKRKVALLMSFCGTGCSGMQCKLTWILLLRFMIEDFSAVQGGDIRTIEGLLFDAMVKAGAISSDNSDDPTKVGQFHSSYIELFPNGENLRWVYSEPPEQMQAFMLQGT